MRLNVTEFFKYFIIHPDSDLLDKQDRAIALISSIALGVFTLGLCHLVCALAFRSYKPLPPGSSTPATSLFEKTYGAESPWPIPLSPRPTPASLAVLPDKVDAFWMAYYDQAHPELLRFLQMALLKEKEKAEEQGGELDYQRLAFDLVNYYSLTKLFKSLDRARLTSEEEKLIANVAFNLSAGKQEIKIKKQAEVPRIASANIEPRTVIELPAGKSLAIYHTGGDGSCGFYALLGEPINSQYGHRDIKGLRKEFCDYLRRKHQAHQLPDQIKNVIDDYFLNFKEAPSAFQKGAQAIHDKLFAQYPKIDRATEESRKKELIAEQERLKREFLENKTVFEAYLEHLAKHTTYLLQDELIAVALWKNLAIRLVQPGWGEARGIAAFCLFNEGEGRSIVDIYYNGHNHYERALFIE